jgi:hypothetical protein
MKAKTIKDTLKESGAGGAGYATWGGGWGRSFGSPSMGGRFTGRGFGFGSNSGSGPNVMYTYSIKPLNKTLEPAASDQLDHEIIHIGSIIKGKVLGKDKHMIGQVLKAEQDFENNVKWYLILDPETSTKWKIDPTTAFIWKAEPEGPDSFGQGVSPDTPTVESFIGKLDNFDQKMIVRESLNFDRWNATYESLVSKYMGKWSHTEIEIYKNPPSIKRMGIGNRAISDLDGNIYVADDADTTHSEMLNVLYRDGIIDHDWYHAPEDTDDETLILCGWQRYSNSRSFYISETFSAEEIEEMSDQFRLFGEAAQKKNPRYDFIWNMSITDVGIH